MADRLRGQGIVMLARVLLLMITVIYLTACTTTTVEPQATAAGNTKIKNPPLKTEPKKAQIKLALKADPSVPKIDPAVSLCEAVGTKLGSVSIDDCLQHQLVHSAYTINNRSLAYKDYEPFKNRESLGRVMIVGGIHGDEFSSISVTLKWMNILDKHHSGLFHWRFIPALNPDGLLSKKSQRQNANGVDLNRNFPTSDWEELAIPYWREITKNNPRRDPGITHTSELETQWLVGQIKEFNPDVIISMHAPYHLVDYDGPPTGPNNLGSLYLRTLGVFPGSLGNYVGLDLKKPIVTVELMSAGIMPAEQEINQMWSDLVRWLRFKLAP